MAVVSERPAAVIRVPRAVYKQLQALAGNQPISDVLGDLVDQEVRRRMLDSFNASFARLKADPAAWAAYQAEQRALEGTLADGLDATDEGWDADSVDTATW